MALVAKFGSNDGPRINLRVSPAVDARIRAMAERRQVPCSDLVRLWIDRGLVAAERLEQRRGQR